MLAHIPPATTGFTARLVDALPLSPTPQLCVRWGYPSSPAMPESPFAPWRYYLAGGPVTRSSIGITQPSSLLRAHAPDHAPPPACGRPSVWGVCADCCEPLLRHGPSRRYLCVSVPRCVDPYPGGVVGARTHYFPTTIGLPPVLMGSAPRANPFSDFRTGGDFGAAVIHSCSGLEVCCHPGHSHRRVKTRGSRGVYVRAEHRSLPSGASDMLAVRTGN